MNGDSQSVTPGTEDRSGHARLPESNDGKAKPPTNTPKSWKERLMSTVKNLTRDDDWFPLVILFLIWAVTVFGCWVCFSFTDKEIKDIPPGLVAMLGLLLGGKGVRDYLLNQKTPKNRDPDHRLLRFMFLFGAIAVFWYWGCFSITGKEIMDIPPTLVATLGLLLGGEGVRDYFLRKIKRSKITFNQYSLSTILFFLGGMTVLVLWIIETHARFETDAASGLADIPNTVVAALGLLAGGESTRVYLHSKS